MMRSNAGNRGAVAWSQRRVQILLPALPTMRSNAGNRGAVAWSQRRVQILLPALR